MLRFTRRLAASVRNGFHSSRKWLVTRSSGLSDPNAPDAGMIIKGKRATPVQQRHRRHPSLGRSRNGRCDASFIFNIFALFSYFLFAAMKNELRPALLFIISLPSLSLSLSLLPAGSKKFGNTHCFASPRIPR